ncbi:bifunctional folylpolyglutamate synthase/dihydrofolate synthase [Occallatibacter riparius]|uniref:Dihydrofolate synthase/folylpolyglutamate synthase n=1 Tax=Occallatibacter riparius TaxID=1002689 RepID=A0A9J7BXK9_9BACT|nr:folylpolyglutamate synthase/dihydrofolate synthase family protein [Occallatibacter riparius]UWZ85750.1 bifunctional folylpolyglutamate synthase/dihydrofolate synthase [Occallatibacter riparius]
MSYAAAIDALNALAPELHTAPGRPRRKFSLAEIGILLDEMGNPQHSFRSILIAGTNGKGSTAATLASILRETGLRTGLYTSPHLERPNERIRVDGAEISDADFSRHYFAMAEAADALVSSGKLAQSPSFFETLTAMAFLHFAEAGVEIAVLEVGMGGRLDATNIVDPLISVITDISLDHTEWLGPTVAAIAREKAGILRCNGVLVTLPQHPEANQAIGEIATELNARGVNAAVYVPALGPAGDLEPGTSYPLEVLGRQIQVASPLAGAHQHRNIALAIAAAIELQQNHSLPITADSIERGIRNTQWPGRFEMLHRGNTTWILDVAHNPAGAWALRSGLRSILDRETQAGRTRTLVFSCLKDKPVAELAQILFPLFDLVIFAPIASPRATAVESLLEAAAATGTPAESASSIYAALQHAEHDSQGVIVVSGSVYLVGDARALLLGHRSAQA